MKRTLLFIVLVTVFASTFFVYKPDVSAQGPDPHDVRCATTATGNGGPSGFGRFPFSVDLYPGQTAITTFRTYVCNASNATIRDWTFTSASSVVLETGRTNALDYGPTGWSGPSGGFYLQDMGTFAPHEWRRRDVNMGVRESAFDGPGVYTIRVSGMGRIWDSSFGCFYPDPTCYGQTNVIDIDLTLTVNRPDITCAGSSISPATPAVGQSFTITNSYAATDNSINNTYRLDATLRDPSGAIIGGGPNVSYTVVNPNSLTYDFPPWTDTGLGGTYTVSTALSIPGAPWFDPVVCNASFSIANRPYFKAYGDVSAGSGFLSGTTCAVDPAALIAAFNRGTNPYLGSGTQLAAYAFGAIDEFATGQIRSPATTDFLSFANTTPGYGGLWANNAANAACAPDFYADVSGPDPGVNMTINPGDDGNFSHTGDMLISSNAVGVGTGRKVSVYVDGDVFIIGNINFQTSGGNYNSPVDVPFFRLIVRGNIYVGPNVTSISGTYVAQPDPASPNTTGRFYTCGTFFWAGNTPPNVPNDTQLVNNCNSRLTVYGSVVAEVVKLLRTRGTLSQATAAERYNSGNATEVFVNTPEAWINGSMNSGNGQFDYVTGLPPVL